MTDVNNRATDLLAKALGMDTNDIGPDTALGVTPQWDSLAHMRIILALEKPLGQQLSPEEILSITGITDVATLLENI